MKLYRITYDNIGIYEALKNNVSFDIWKSLLKNNIFTWLPKPPEYLNGYFSYFTEQGFNKFKTLVLPICEKYLDKNKIKIEQFKHIDNIIYRDEYQVVIDQRHKIFESKFDQLYLDILNEAKYDDQKWQRYDVYKGIEIYYNIDHVIQRLNQRYPLYTFSYIRRIVKKMLKDLIKQNIFQNIQNAETFICYFTISDVWLAGRFKKNFGEWRLEINTLLPKNPTYPNNFLFKEINA